MKRTIFFFVALVVSFSATALAQDGNIITVETPTGIPSFVGYVENEFIIVFKRGMGPATVGRSPEGVPTIGVPDFDAIGRAYGVSRIKKQFRGTRSEELACYYKVKFTIGTREQAMAAYRNHPLVDHVEPIGIHTTFLVPNDPLYPYPPYQWHLNQSSDHDIDAPEAWDIETGSEAVIVGIPDTGVRYFHKDLGGSDASYSDPGAAKGNMWINWAEKNGDPGVDDDPNGGNGFVDDWIGWDFVSGASLCRPGEDCSDEDNDPRDFEGHGTHCSGIVSAITNNAWGVAGIAGGRDEDGIEQPTANGVKIMALRIGWGAIGGGGYVRMDYAAEAFYYAADNGANIVSCSWGSSNSGGIEAAVNYFLGKGGLIFKSAGNANNQSADYLCSRLDVTSVAATDPNDCKASFSSYGTWVDIAAPGVDVFSLYHDSSDAEADHYAWANGTSMASPLAAGVAALIWSKECTWTAAQVMQQLYDTADDIDGLSCNSTYAGKLGAGRVNAHNAVNTSPSPPRPQAAFTADTTAVCADDVVYFTDQSTNTDATTVWSWDFGDEVTSAEQNPSHTYTNPGTYTVTLTVTGPGCPDTETKTDYITVSAVPDADFLADTTTGCAPLTVNFTDLSTGNPDSWNWNFGDLSSPSAEQNPSHTYNDPGTYTVTLAASNACGLDEEIKVGYVVVDLPCGATKAFALSDIPVKGTMSGSFMDTHASDDVYEVITERESGGKPSNRHSMLEHKWDFNVAPGANVTFYLEAYRPDNGDGDDFSFEYSTDNVTFFPLVAVKSAVEDTYTAPLDHVSGTIYIRVVDTDQTSGNRSLDPVYIDSMYIESQGEPQLTIITESLPDGTVDEFYSETVEATGGTLPYTWAIISGSLPSGLELNPNTGEIYGTPTTEQTSNFTVQVTDLDEATDTADFSITILAVAPAPEVSFCDPASGGQNQRFPVTIVGENFQAGATVSFGEGITVQTTNVNSLQEIVCNIKIGKKAAFGARDVVVTNPDGQYGTLYGGFSVTP